MSKSAVSCVYFVWPSNIPFEHAIVKIGSWTGSLSDLRKRYVTCFGDSLDILIFECEFGDALKVERWLQNELTEYHVENELFRSACLSAIPDMLHCHNYVMCRHGDHPISRQARQTAEEKQRRKQRRCNTMKSKSKLLTKTIEGAVQTFAEATCKTSSGATVNAGDFRMQMQKWLKVSVRQKDIAVVMSQIGYVYKVVKQKDTKKTEKVYLGLRWRERCDRLIVDAPATSSNSSC